jgi:glycerol-3-phosphate O-acyltransferase / dihydroxyacetone phosphate acyltransferase
MKINLFLRLFYRFLQGLVWVSYWVYFRRIIFINEERFKTNGPLLVLSNHPNTLMDPLMAVYRLRERCFLLANYSLFKNPITNWILSTLYCIPIQRPKDVVGQVPKNDEAFKKCDAHLMAGGSIYIAAEGTSFIERHVREFKTGAARIAFSAENKTDFNLNLRVLLIGITYTNPLKFRGDAIVELREPIDIDPWREAYEKDPRDAIQDLTQHLEDEIKKCVIHCRDMDEDAFLLKVETLIQSQKPLNTEGAYYRGKTLLQALNAWEIRDTDGFSIFKKEIETYYSNINSLKINDLDIQKFNPTKVGLSILLFILGLPVFIYGFINNLLTIVVSNGMIKILKADYSYNTTIRYAAGVFLSPLFWWLQTKILYAYFDMPLPWWIYVLTIIPTGLLAWGVYKLGVKMKDYFLFKINDKTHNLSVQRNILVHKIEALLSNNE